MATYFSNCSDNEENFNLCLQHSVAGFPSTGYYTGDLIYLIFRKKKRWFLGAKGHLLEPTDIKPWEDSENYKSAFKINWEVIYLVDITDTLKEIYPNYGLAIQGKKNLETFQDRGEQFNESLSKFFQNSRTSKQAKMKTHNTKDVIRHVYDYIKSQGFFFTEEEIGNFYLSLKTKPFVILAGISGTGKTQLPRKFAEAIGMSKEQVIQVPVRPDWNDSSDLIGYTSLDGKFIAKPLIQAVLIAKENPKNPYFFILDEMNLARVEHYFSDFLSLIETRELNKDKKIITDELIKADSILDEKDRSLYGGLHIPENLYLIGTVNMDETTHAFSRKVLDRANSIEMNGIDLNWQDQQAKAISPLNNVGQSFFRTEYLSSKDLSSSEKNSVSSYIQQLITINSILEKADLHFAYRVRDEIAFYLILNNKNEILDSIIAMDFQLMQKILPRIHGSSKRVQSVLVSLLNFLENKRFNSEDFNLEEISDFCKDPESFKYKRSTKKIIFMLERFEDDRFTSFWL